MRHVVPRTDPVGRILDMSRAARHVPGAPDRVFRIITAVCLGAIACKMLFGEVGKER